jgi:FKBP-type peptidyl-prolyl cis-trans isomerase FkpA
MRRFAPLLVFALVAVACDGSEGSTSCARDTVVESSGLEFQDLRCGEGDAAGGGTKLTVDYHGELVDGAEFDTRTSFEFVIGSEVVIEGFEEGVIGMAEGGIRRLEIPPELGYGTDGLPPDIPPNATLIFEVKLVDVAEI